MLQNYNLETKHYVILAVLGVVEFVLFALMFYNCIIELRQKRRQRKYEYAKRKKPHDEESATVTKPSLMEIFSVDMTLNRDSTGTANYKHHNHNHHQHHHLHKVGLPPHVNGKINHCFGPKNHHVHRPSRNSL
ncbi:uncharacterized protein LOC110853445 [Folsomia candida]|uniref:Uncharacterized protein n=1 Tax=Folsomia candida TaxID=158441 RepID=A0A226E1J7_FOLCA|nr:uncharacterized protein LOC110853445 [Folsomia candida]OXA50904.1 hypothetical protein Fcan01_13916 [Folsomia candida]